MYVAPEVSVDIGAGGCQLGNAGHCGLSIMASMEESSLCTMPACTEPSVHWMPKLPRRRQTDGNAKSYIVVRIDS